MKNLLKKTALDKICIVLVDGSSFMTYMPKLKLISNKTNFIQLNQDIYNNSTWNKNSIIKKRYENVRTKKFSYKFNIKK